MPRHLEVVQNVRSFFSEKLVQISLVSGVLFYIVANSTTFLFVEKKPVLEYLPDLYEPYGNKKDQRP